MYVSTYGQRNKKLCHVHVERIIKLKRIDDCRIRLKVENIKKRKLYCRALDLHSDS